MNNTNCPLCNKELNDSNKPLEGQGQISGGQTICANCLHIANGLSNDIKNNLSTYSAQQILNIYNEKSSSHQQKKALKPKSNKMLFGCLGIAVFFFVIMIVFISNCSNDANNAPVSRESKINMLFDPIDGSQFNVDAWIKKNINDPNSYEHIETNHWDMKDSIIVKTVFTAKNGFGGRVKGYCEAVIDENANIIHAKIFQQ